MKLGTIRGYANVFSEQSSPLDGDEPLIETIKPGAFQLLRVVEANVQHRASARIATTWDQSLRLWQDAYGLAFELDIPATLAGAGLRNMVAGGFNAMSIGLIIHKATYSRDEDGVLCRDVTRCDIDHVTICDSGAYRSACCWVAETPADHMHPEIAAAARHWQLGRIAHAKKQAESRAFVASYLAKIDVDRRRPAAKRKPHLIQIPEIPEAMRAAMEMGLYL